VSRQPGVVVVVAVFAVIHVTRRGTQRSFNEAVDRYEKRTSTDDR